MLLRGVRKNIGLTTKGLFLVVEDLASISIRFVGFTIPAQKILKRNIARRSLCNESLYDRSQKLKKTSYHKSVQLIASFEVSGNIPEKSHYGDMEK
ncbi:uncharacterized protein [Montipora capricornis]|uniref:uncharacterized protein isoform X3 n=1 Tax=Montipora capricornis TaxID=246305 RepID=UPI0035F16304